VACVSNENLCHYRSHFSCGKESDTGDRPAIPEQVFCSRYIIFIRPMNNAEVSFYIRTLNLYVYLSVCA